MALVKHSKKILRGQSAQNESAHRRRAGLHGRFELHAGAARFSRLHLVRSGVVRAAFSRSDPTTDDCHE